MSTQVKQAYQNVKKINWGEVVAILAVILSIGGWCLTRIDRQFDKIDRQFDKIDDRFSKIELTLDRIERDNRDFHGRLSKLEGKVEERGKKEK